MAILVFMSCILLKIQNSCLFMSFVRWVELSLTCRNGAGRGWWHLGEGLLWDEAKWVREDYEPASAKERRLRGQHRLKDRGLWDYLQCRGPSEQQRQGERPWGLEHVERKVREGALSAFHDGKAWFVHGWSVEAFVARRWTLAQRVESNA